MKKYLFFLSLCLISHLSFAQKNLLDVIDNFYPANPFYDKFSVFLETLLTSKYIANRTIHRRTDTSMYFFKGDFTMQNPFLFQPTRTEVILAEKEIRVSDTSKNADTIFLYQLVGYTNDGLRTVENEFKKFQHEHGKQFESSTHSDIRNAEKQEGATYNYFLNISTLSPLSVSWGRMNNNEFAFVVTVRLLVKQNEALLPFLGPDQ